MQTNPLIPLSPRRKCFDIKPYLTAKDIAHYKLFYAPDAPNPTESVKKVTEILKKHRAIIHNGEPILTRSTLMRFYQYLTPHHPPNLTDKEIEHYYTIIQTKQKLDKEKKKEPTPLSLYRIRKKRQLYRRIVETTRKRRKIKQIRQQDNYKKALDLLDIPTNKQTEKKYTHTLPLKEYLAYS